MPMRAKTKRRLLVLLAGTVAVGSAVGGVYRLRVRRAEAELVRAREAGLEALLKHDYHAALHKVGSYLRGHPQDVAAMFAYAEARQKMVRPWARAWAPWRVRWMELANHPAVAEPLAADWLQELAAVAPADALEERIRLAQAWQQLGGNTAAVTGGQSEAVAILCEEDGDLQAAQELYRAALQKENDLVVSMNNLAMLLARGGGDLAEAAKLAAAAVQARPEIAPFWDTLGYVQSKRGQVEQVLESVGKAVELEPGNCAYRINLAWALLEHGQREKAVSVLNRVETFQPDSLPLSQEASSRLQLLRTRLAAVKVM